MAIRTTYALAETVVRYIRENAPKHMTHTNYSEFAEELLRKGIEQHKKEHENTTKIIITKK